MRRLANDARIGVPVVRQGGHGLVERPSPRPRKHHDIPVSLSLDTSVWMSGDLFSAMRSTLGADRLREDLEAHANLPAAQSARAGRPPLTRRRTQRSVNGRLVKHDHRPVEIDLERARGLVESTVEHL